MHYVGYNNNLLAVQQFFKYWFTVTGNPNWMLQARLHTPEDNTDYLE